MLELSGTIPESADKVGIPTLRRTISELSRFLHCAENHQEGNRLVIMETTSTTSKNESKGRHSW